MCGITLRNTTTDSITKIESDMFGINDPSKIMFVVPADLANGSYELTITTQYMKGKTGVRKTPNSVSIPVFVGQQGGGGSYQLTLETWFSTNSTQLKQSRTLTYAIPLVVGGTSGGGGDDRPEIE